MNEAFFWLCFGGVAYAYLGYPLLIWLAAKVKPKAIRRDLVAPRSISVVIAAHNEEEQIGRRVAEFARALRHYSAESELIVVSDGSLDRTAEVAKSETAFPVQVVELNKRSGKAAALNAGCAAARKEIVLFADARQTWAADAISLLVENFADPTVGAASGDLVLESSPGEVAGVGAYWRYEKWLRKNESRFYSLTGVTGAICAVRRELFQPLPDGTLLDDVYWPLQVVMQRFRVVHDERAKAYDRLPTRTSDEFRRKVRTLTGNYQLLALSPRVLLPWRNPVWLQFISHKLLRLVAPWALIGMLAMCASLLDRQVYRLLFAGQVVFYALAAGAVLGAVRGRLASLAASFLVLNYAAWLAFWVWASGRAGASWRKTLYAAPPTQEPAS